MWEPFIQSIQTHVPEAASKMVFDRFHIMQHMGEAVDRVRRGEHRALRALGDETLTRSKYLWLYGAENVPAHHEDRFLSLLKMDLKTARARALKESLRHLWSYRRQGWAERHVSRWYFRATHSRLEPVIAAARMVKRHLPTS